MKPSWSPEMVASWDRLIRHEFDHPDIHLSFTDRLARDNDWTMSFATLAVEEYRRFCFLAVHADHPVTPSDAVDQVWHLHLSYSRDYWESFCPDVLRKALHHGPTEGGPQEDGKYRDWYIRTLESYREFFNKPDPEIWPGPDERFVDSARFIRLNVTDVTIVKAKSLIIAAALSAVIFGVAVVIALTGSEIALGFALATAIATGLLILALPFQDKRKGTAHTSGCGASGGDSGCGSGCGGGGCGG